MIKVKFNKDVHTIRLGSEEHNGQPGGDNNSDNNSNSKVITLQTIKQILAEKTGLAAVDIKLIRDGKVLPEDYVHVDSTPGDNNGGGVVTMVMVASDSSLVMEKPKSYEMNRVINDLSGSSLVDRKRDTKNKNVVVSKNFDYGFDNIVTLPNLPMEDKARQILLDLANDEGVLKVCESRYWKIKNLCEMYPEGMVGVDDVCVLGLNQNKGEKIFLRLRTDDMEGFRNINSIRKVLCHELAHNYISDHNAAFYNLMRQLEKEVVDLNWKNTKSNTVGGGGISHPFFDDHIDEHMNIELPSDDSDSDDEKPYRFLGGNSSTRLTYKASVAAGRAALLRLSAEEQDIEERCGCCAEIEKRKKKEKQLKKIDKMKNRTPEDKQYLGPLPKVNANGKMKPTMVTSTMKMIDDSVTAAVEICPEVAPIEILEKLRTSVYTLCTADKGTGELSEIFGVMESILKNAIARDEEKHIQINKKSGLFTRYLLVNPAALTILSVAGFVDDVPSSAGTGVFTGTDGGSDHMRIKRYDKALLYICHGMVELALEKVKEFRLEMMEPYYE